MIRHRWLLFAFFIICTFLWPGNIRAQNEQYKTLQRRYVPIILKGYQMVVDRMRTDEWKAFRYQADTNTWHLIPFQVDEVDAKGKYNKENDGIIDTNDEMLFMPGDLGDRAGPSRWLSDANAQRAERLELAFTDPVDGTQAWAYLYRNVSVDQQVSGYLDYTPSPDGSAADTARSIAYNIGHTRAGWIDFISLSLAPGTNLVDRLKLRLAGETFFNNVGAYVFTEDTLNEDKATYHPGVIRAFHDEENLLSVPQLWPTPLNVDYKLHYFPYSFRIGVNDAQLQSPLLLAMAGLKTFRQSLDLSEAARGMLFYSEKNTTGVLIDGSPDDVDRALAQSAGTHWVMASGDLGTILMMLEMPEIPGSTTELYYLDQLTSQPLDGTLDTGDGHSFGDMGLWVHGDVLATDRITMNFTIYLIDQPNLNADFAARLFAWQQQPLTVEMTKQDYPATGVKDGASAPERFRLFTAYPNPAARGSKVNFAIESASRGSFRFAIYNTIGQSVFAKTIRLRPGQQQVLTWNGRDEFSVQPVPAGIYFYRLLGNGTSTVRKLLVLP